MSPWAPIAAAIGTVVVAWKELNDFADKSTFEDVMAGKMRDANKAFREARNEVENFQKSLGRQDALAKQIQPEQKRQKLDQFADSETSRHQALNNKLMELDIASVDQREKYGILA